MSEDTGFTVNPLELDGLEFIEYAAPNPAALSTLFEQMGFTRVAHHRSKQVVLYRQGNIRFILNADPEGFAHEYAQTHGPTICAVAFRVKNAAAASKRAQALGAWQVETQA